MYHAMACLTVPKLSYLGEHSEVSQARSKINKKTASATALVELTPENALDTAVPYGSINN